MNMETVNKELILLKICNICNIQKKYIYVCKLNNTTIRQRLDPQYKNQNNTTVKSIHRIILAKTI